MRIIIIQMLVQEMVLMMIPMTDMMGRLIMRRGKTMDVIIMTVTMITTMRIATIVDENGRVCGS